MLTKGFLKRLLALGCALVCVLALSVPSFAEVSNLTYDECVSKYSASGWGKGYSRTGTVLDIDVSFDGASEEAKEAWKLVMQDWLNDPDYAVIFCLGSSSFWVYANRISDFTGFTYTNNVGNQCLQFSSPGYYFYFSYSSGWSLSIFNINNRSNSVTSSGIPLYRSAQSLVSDERNPRTSYILSDIYTLIVNDDITPDEPDPPSEPEIPVTPPNEPEVPAGNPEYVVYNTGLWLIFFRWVRRHIGNAVFVGFIVLAAVMGIYLILRIIKHYSRQ